MSATKPDYELIAKLKPGLIIYQPDLFSTSDIDKLKELKIDLFAFKAGSIAEFEDTLYRLGGMIKAETNFSEYVDKIEAAIANASTSSKNVKPRVAIVMPGDGSEHMIAGVKSFVADVVRVSGGDVVGPDADKFVTLNAETMVSLNPDVIIVTGDPSSVVNDSRFTSINALKKHRVVGVNQNLILRAGSRLDQLITRLASYL
jgi:iron complex transport system substrate-binding protein